MKKIIIFLTIFFTIFVSLNIYFEKNYATPILAYHSFDAARIDTYAVVDPKAFRRQMEFIKRNGYKVIPLKKYCRFIANGRPVLKKTVVITFDDGHADNLLIKKILQEFNYPVTIFLIRNKIGAKDYLSRRDINGFLKDVRLDLGSHTITHDYLPDLGSEAIKQEIFGSRQRLQKIFGRPVLTIAYPTGGFNEEVLRFVKEAGYLCGCTTNRGFSKSLDRFALQRIKITDRDTGFRLWAKLSGYYNVFRKPKKPY